MGKKSNAQIKRMQRRAEARGEEYQIPISDSATNLRKLEAASKLSKELEKIETNEELKAKDRRSSKRKAEAIAAEEAGCPAEELLEWYSTQKDAGGSDKKKDKAVNKSKLNAARKLEKELRRIVDDDGLNAKDRRSAKRRAEAIATEETGCDPTELLEWFEQNKDSDIQETSKDADEKKVGKRHSNPYIVFIGQLAYSTTKEDLMKHIKKELGKDHKVTEETAKIRLLTDSKTKKSRGMAFVETSDPELLYAFLKLHHTHLDGRRINVERSAGGKSNSDARKSKIAQYRKEQEKFMSETVDKMLDDYKANGDLEENELDDGVIALCKRHSATVIEQALTEYIEARDRDLENPSAYLTFIIGRVATEGVEQSKKDQQAAASRGGAKFGRDSSKGPEKKRHRGNGIENKLKKMSEFSKQGVDMSISNPSQTGISNIFPSMNKRGRGRGAYM
mmetsp:Transcript_31700/g.48603  ORF Transcript_31700/g.48603 Transcript_31700/m.48603 type:complete len:449 (-) Transcript_31700:35-1381(-)